MKQLLFPLLFLPCLALAQYPGNANQKITLGEQTTADGLVYRGLASADTVAATSKITRANKQDTSTYLLLDTTTNLLWHYKIGSNAWLQAGGGTAVTSFSAGTTGLNPSTATTGAVTLAGTLAVANGGTGQTTLAANKVMVGNGTSGVLTPTNLHWDNTNSMLGINASSPLYMLSLGVADKGFTEYKSGNSPNSNHSIKIVANNNGSSFGSQNLNSVGFSGVEYINHLNVIGVFTGFNNANNEYRVNNVISRGTINFLIDGNSSFYIDSLNNNRRVGINTSSPSEQLHVVGNARITGLNGINDVGASATGVLQAATSDINLKNTIENSPFGLNEILLLNPVTFLYNDENRKIDSDVKEVGFIAQDVFDLIPNAVSSTGNGDLQLDYRAITATLVKAIQEQQDLIKALEKRILTLENK